MHFLAAITTTYAGPTDHRGARVLVRCKARRGMVPWDHALSTEENHYRAARGMAEDLGWLAHDQAFIGGVLPTGQYVFVILASYPADPHHLDVAEAMGLLEGIRADHTPRAAKGAE
jgi:hypothetical protein